MTQNRYLPFLFIILISCTNPNTSSMGFFDKIFGKKDKSASAPTPSPELDTTLEKTAEMLDEELYWNIVARSKAFSDDQDTQEQFLITEISKLAPKQMIGFRLRTDKLLYDTYTDSMWCAAYIINGGCSDDGFEYFRNWVISRGKEAYYKAKENPDNLIEEVKPHLDLYEFESFWYVALEAFEQRTGKQLYDYIDEDNFHTKEGSYPPIEFTWQEEKPETMKNICPRLYAAFWEK